MNFRKKPDLIEAFTFDEFVAAGLQTSDNIVDGKPQSFTFRGCPVTYQSDDCYLISSPEGAAVEETYNMTPTDMLIVEADGGISPCKQDIFQQTYEVAP